MARSLYQITVSAVGEYYKYLKSELRMLPEAILFDVYITLYQQGKLCALGCEFSDLDVFANMLKVTTNRVTLLKCFQELMNHGTGVSRELANGYVIKCGNATTEAEKMTMIDLGIRLGAFLNEAGWFAESAKVLSQCKELCADLPETVDTLRKTLECCHKLLHAEVVYSYIEAAGQTKKFAELIADKLKATDYPINLSGLYTEFSLYSFQMSIFDEAYEWSVKAVRELTHKTCPRVVIDTLSQASKACVVKRDLTKASVLIKQAVYLATELFGEDHPRVADVLLDYAYFLLNSDSIKDSVTVYERALELKKAVFENFNLHVAMCHEDFAYALYVHEYSTGRFSLAQHHAEEAIRIMQKILPETHLKLASAQRVKALILEEVALDQIQMNSSETQVKLLAQAEVLHKDALRLSQLSFGENNVQTAKHYGNLGRLYQSMKRYNEAETMHLKAIEIKEQILGKEDYEVGLSIGHLASLYNYHMKEYAKAEALYLRSISIGTKLFSETYSGLQYDYRGLLHVYENMGNRSKKAELFATMAHWRTLREDRQRQETAPLAVVGSNMSLEEIKELFPV